MMVLKKERRNRLAISNILLAREGQVGDSQNSEKTGTRTQSKDISTLQI